MMPRMDGLELCRRLKGDREFDFAPFVLLTAKASTDSRIEGLEVGADDYLPKPFEGRELLARVTNLIESRKRLKQRLVAREKTLPEVALPDVAYAVGFRSVSHFSRRFRERHGVSPSKMNRAPRSSRRATATHSLTPSGSRRADARRSWAPTAL